MHKLIILFTFSLLLFSLEISSADQDDQKNTQNKEEREPSSDKQMVQDSYIHAKAQWERLKYLFNKLQLNLFPPNLE